MSRELGGGFLSTSFDQPRGEQVAESGLEGYYIDFRVKATSPEWPPASLPIFPGMLHVEVAQWGLGAFEHFVATQDERWLAAATSCAEHLLDVQGADGVLPHTRPYPHTYRLEPPWSCAMAQGEAASLFLRLYARTREERFAEAAARAIEPLSRAPLRAPLGDGWFLQEYPTDPPSHVLNGGLFALWAYRDAAIGLEDRSAAEQFEAGVDTLAANIGRWDTGRWSLYDLYPHPVTQVASGAYHELHIDQLLATHAVAPRPELSRMAARWQAYGASAMRRGAAFAQKALFRLAVPRNRMLAHRLPWS